MAHERIAVFGATGRLGRLVVGALRERGASVRCIVRDEPDARRMFDGSVEIATGDLDRSETLAPALSDVARVFLLTPLQPHPAERQRAAIAAAAEACVRHIVKLSGSSWTMLPGRMSMSGTAHNAVERALAQSWIAHTIVRPNAFMQTSLGGIVAELRQGHRFTSALGTGRVGFIDARDIAGVAATLLTTPIDRTGIVEITGPESLDMPAIERIATTLHGRAVQRVELTIEEALEAARAMGADANHLRHMHEMLILIRSGVADRVTDDVPRLLARPARSVAAFLAEALGC
jgi:uncharacterized protein YbjT (DUF2867 family)